MFGFRNIKVFDPRRTIMLALTSVPAPFVLLWFFGPHAGAFGLAVSVAWFFAVSNADRRRPNAVSFLLESFAPLEVVADGSRLVVDVEYATVGRIDSKLRRHKVRKVRPGLRAVPVLLRGRGIEYAWVEQDRVVPLSPDEAAGAVDVVLSGEHLGIEVLLGALPGSPPATLAVALSSDNGSLHSWHPLVDPTLPERWSVPEEMLAAR